MNMLQHLRFLTAGESHGKGLSGILEGFPAGVPLSESFIARDLARRQMGHGRGGRMTIEKDHAEILSGLRHGYTLGSPIALWIQNRDWENWKQDKMSHNPPLNPVPDVTLPRPGHADLAGTQKFGFSDIRNVLERSSARETAMRVALGAVCRSFLNELGVEIFSHVVQIGPVKSATKVARGDAGINTIADASAVRCLDKKAAEAMIKHIDETRRKGDSIGGVFEVLASGLPAGLGSYTHWDRKLDARLAAAMMSINAMKSVSIGDGLDVAGASGSQVHDEIIIENNHIRRATNHAGGIEGGMSNGELIQIQVTMKPIPTLAKPLRSVDIKTREPGMAHKERTDACAVPAASVIGEAMMALVLTDALLEKFGGDSLDQIKRHIAETGIR
jgi:chorismate synthase